MDLLVRHAQTEIERYRKVFPAVGIVGPRQSGKTTLARQILAAHSGSVAYFDLERQADFTATRNVDLFLDSLRQDLIVIDEIQRRPELFVALRGAIDVDRQPGRFLLLGSASPHLLRDSSESLAGRIGYIELPPLNWLEVKNRYTRAEHWLKGGFPNSLHLADEDSMLWRDQFVRTYVERDIRTLRPNIDAGTLMRLLPMLAHVHGQALNYSMLSKSLSVSSPTIKRYVELLEGSFLVRTLEPFFSNARKRLAKAPKLFVRDTGVLHALLGIGNPEQLLRHPQLGASWEGYVIEQICQALSTSAEVFTFRTNDGAELDLVIQPRGKTQPIAVEVKLSDAPTLSRGNYQAIDAVQPSVTFVVTPEARQVELQKGIVLISLDALLEELAAWM